MNISICITTFNEEASIAELIDSLVNQTKKPDEIVIVDGGSVDKTLEIISHYQKKFGIIKLLKERCTRAKGRNLSIEIARNDIVAITDAGCVADKDWLKNISGSFATGKVDISAGFYHMVSGSTAKMTSFQKAESVFLGVTPQRFNASFLPSTRSVAFRKSAWESVGGFPEGGENSAEDTDFNYKAVKLGLKYARVKSAIVEWGMPLLIRDFFSKIRDYAKWDIRYGIWWHPSQRFASHNIKALFVILRYLVGLTLLILSFWYGTLPYLLILILTYFVWSFRKVLTEFGDWRIALWGPILQIASDFAVMSGFISGIISV